MILLQFVVLVLGFLFIISLIICNWTVQCVSIITQLLGDIFIVISIISSALIKHADQQEATKKSYYTQLYRVILKTVVRSSTELSSKTVDRTQE